MRRFKNRYSNAPHDGAKALRWMVDFARRPWTRVEFPMAGNDPVWLRANRSETSLTWVGHATFLLQVAGLNILTDPHFTERASPFAFAGPQRFVRPGLQIADLPPIDLVLLSHNHYDHLDAGSVKALARRNPEMIFVVPLGVAEWFHRRGFRNTVELEWWQSAEVLGAHVTSVPVQHFSGRGLNDRNQTQWCGLLLELSGRRIFFAGDTGYSHDFADIGERFAPIDLALLPIGAYDPRWFMGEVHVDPFEAVRIHQDIGSRLSVAMHWGTFRLTEEPVDEPPRKLEAALHEAGIGADRFLVFRHGETRRIDLEQATAATTA